MPNHFTTTAICSNGYSFDVCEFLAEHAQTNLCNAVLPMPDAMKGIAVGYRREDDCSQWDEKTGEGHTEAKMQELTEEYGAANSLDWARKFWGLKWGTYDLAAMKTQGDGSPVIITFCSPWNAPSCLSEIAGWLSSQGQFEKVQFVFFNPYDDSTSMGPLFEFPDVED